MSKKIHSAEKTFNYRLLTRLRQANETINVLRQREMKTCDITPEQARALHVIHYFGNQATAIELARVLSRKPPAITFILRRMEKKQLIKKTLDKKKKNTIRLGLTRKGHELYHKTMELPMLGSIFSQLSTSEKDQLCTLLEKLRNLSLKKMNIDAEAYIDLVNKLDLE